jgi:hypothetical protein
MIYRLALGKLVLWLAFTWLENEGSKMKERPTQNFIPIAR